MRRCIRPAPYARATPRSAHITQQGPSTSGWWAGAAGERARAHHQQSSLPRAPGGRQGEGAHQLQSCSMMRRTSAAQAARSLYQAVSALRTGPGSRARGGRRPGAARCRRPPRARPAEAGGRPGSAPTSARRVAHTLRSDQRAHATVCTEISFRRRCYRQQCSKPASGRCPELQSSPPWAIIIAAAWQGGLLLGRGQRRAPVERVVV